MPAQWQATHFYKWLLSRIAR